MTKESVYTSSDTDHDILKTNELNNNNKELPTSWPQTPRCDAADAALLQHRERNGTRALVCRQIQYAYVAVALSSLKKKSGDLFGRRLLLTENKC